MGICLTPCLRARTYRQALLPGAHITLHNGYAGYSDKVLRAHLGLRVPEGCLFEVDGQRKAWENDKWLIFDDTL